MFSSRPSHHGVRLLLLVLLLGACSPRPVLQLPSRPFLPEEVTPTVPPRDAPLRVLAPYVNNEADRFRHVLGAFQTGAGVPVDYTGDPRIPDALLGALEEEQPPDVVVLPKPHWLGELAGAGVLAPLSSEASAEVRDNYVAGWQSLVAYSGSLYGVPLYATSKSMVWYRPAALARINRSVPQRWDEWLALNRALADAGETPVALPGGEGWTLTDWFENVFLHTAGPDTYLKLVRHEIAWTDPAVRSAFQRLGEMLREEWLVGGTAGATAAPLAETLTAVFDPSQPAGAMILGQGGFAPFILDKHPDLVPLRDVDFFPFPAIEPAYRDAVEGTVHIAVALTDRPEAMALLAFLASPEAAAEWVEYGEAHELTIVSPSRALPLTSYPNDFTRREAQQLTGAGALVPDLSDTVPSAVGETLTEGLRRYLREPGEIDTILQGIEEAARRTQG